MMIRKLLASAMVLALFMSSGTLFSADEPQKQEQVYGSQIMTPQERDEHRAKMRAAKTPEEREKIRKEHHEKMKERAKERGVTLPDEPPARRGSGMGRGGY